MIEKTEIQLSKTKLLLMLLGSAAFVCLGIFFMLNPGEIRPNKQTFIQIVGMASVLFFGLCLIFIARKMFDQKIGLMIDENGITDNSSGTSVGLIEWGDINEIASAQIASTKFILIGTTEAEKYINRAGNALTKRAMQANQKLYGTPLSIASNTLKIKHNDLLAKVTESFEIMNKSNKV